MNSTNPTDQHREQAREIVRPCVVASDTARSGRLLVTAFDETITNRIAAALAARDAEVREVLEGLSIVMNYANGAVRCWCFSRDGLHSPPCTAARTLYAKLQPLPGENPGSTFQE